jgi:hypothetical protein
MNKDENENFHRFALSGELFEREKETERKIVLGYYIRVTFYP